MLVKSDGFPTYHLAFMVDDHLMEITHVLRGQEWLPSAPMHIILYHAFGWDPPVFCHLPTIMGKDGHKLSKRLGSTSVRDFRAQGYLPDALLNCIALVGWSYDGSRELFTLKELEELFDHREAEQGSRRVRLPEAGVVQRDVHQGEEPPGACGPDRSFHEEGRTSRAMTGRCSKEWRASSRRG